MMYNLIVIGFIGMLFMLLVAYVVKTICLHTENHPDRNISIDLKAPGFHFKAEASAAKSELEADKAGEPKRAKPKVLRFRER